MIRLKRVYEARRADDGTRFLVERLWPRGIKKNELQYSAWLKDAAPSTELRRWFRHDPGRWEEFRRRYYSELDLKPESWAPILSASGSGKVTLLFSSRDREHNNAVALKEYLSAKESRKA